MFGGRIILTMLRLFFRLRETYYFVPLHDTACCKNTIFNAKKIRRLLALFQKVKIIMASWVPKQQLPLLIKLKLSLSRLDIFKLTH